MAGATAERLEADLCVVGAGSAGLSIAAGASQLGARVVLIEAGAMGGDCLNVGCVPSKALIAAARAATLGERAAGLGVAYGPPAIDFAAVMGHVHRTVAAIAPVDSEERYSAMGVTVLRGRACFLDPRTVAVGERRIAARRFVLATGSRPFVPPLPGLDAVPYLTNETVFALEALPRHLLVLGGGAIGCELGQAFRRLGAEVSIVEQGRLLAGEDPELVEPLRRRLLAEGVALREGARAERAEAAAGGLRLTLATEAGAETLEASHLLVAAGRRSDFAGLGLDGAGIALDERGRLQLDGRLRTTNRRVFAAGDAAGGPCFTHLAGHHAGVVLKNVLFRLPAGPERLAVPRVTYAEPELAQVGPTEAELRAQGRRFEVLRSAFFENDRAQCEGETEGLVKVLVTPRGRVLGAGIAGPQAGELILPWVLAVKRGMKAGDLAQAIVPYPTRSEASKRAAAGYFLPRLFSERSRRLVRLLRRLG
ncbi:Pyruvate/2-oxoglutarate dehydrogenase complex, dihydrolipoamide dehydrogenase (E3) component [Tistlia consotensis]|uniref:Pyruvate/2-oxoglutarate dehydrogenase complex, dihydrolipoamide dehydrogenase (E3) component n=1 Tax=Tistlia consotensis USBA 355 TaxID=560819 RepID=A0A1Y6B4S6_9PROT|nr:FAD-dependent oxidoreductase [Tistlia consotensis]SME92070.1 Pyruvate/2-oxoglutarate dehydrogenase complex, dihydrolipoamide dehydrogenase (E3) component [Tistlia consotensis USBA 355]SNR27807.1 Pyruvate/2-oxoglutarate dehydrogenase complex, dihydrolipoamide dehydrogenase (E3) component [Tistlia consotensis]